jgi:hypothetical protein
MVEGGKAMPEIDEQVKDAMEKAEGGSRLNSAVAILVAITATFMALSHIKDGNIVLAMDHAQAKAVDTWSYYQAKSLKGHQMEFGREQARTRLEAGDGLTPEGRQHYEKTAADYDKQIQRYDKEKEEVKKQAEEFEEKYNQYYEKHDQFDIAEAAYSIAIALAGITALTRKAPLFFFALLLSLFGLVVSAAGFAGWSLHLGAVTKFLGA